MRQGGRVELVRQAAGFRDRLLEQVGDRRGQLLRVAIALDPAGQETQMELGRRQQLLQIVVQDLGQSFALAVLRL